VVPWERAVIRDTRTFSTPIANRHPASDAGNTSLLLAPEQVAVELMISRNHVFRLMRAGELPFVRVGRLYRVPRSDLLGFVERHRADRQHATTQLRVRRRVTS